MPNRNSDDRHPEPLSEPAAARLLARASELDAALRAGSSVADLRAAATEAGISTSAFDAALKELQAREQPPLPEVRHRSPRRTLTFVAASLMLVAAYTASSYLFPGASTDEPAAPDQVAETAILLRCLSAGEAAELVRPLLGERWNRVSHSVSNPSVLTVEATLVQLQQVKSALDEHEREGSRACTARPAPVDPSR